MSVLTARRFVGRLQHGAAAVLEHCVRPSGEPQGASGARWLRETCPSDWGPSRALAPSGRDAPLALLQGQRLDGFGGDARSQRPVMAGETSVGAEGESRVRPWSRDIRPWSSSSATCASDAPNGFGAPHRACLPCWVVAGPLAPFALSTAFPCALDGRPPVDDDEAAVTRGLAPRRRSRVPCSTARLEPAGGAPVIPLHRGVIDRLSGAGDGAQKSHAPLLTASPVDAGARSVQGHRWGLGCKQWSFRLIMRALQDGTISVF
jgi:hypothetical protein